MRSRGRSEERGEEGALPARIALWFLHLSMVSYDGGRCRIYVNTKFSFSLARVDGFE